MDVKLNNGQRRKPFYFLKEDEGSLENNTDRYLLPKNPDLIFANNASHKVLLSPSSGTIDDDRKDGSIYF